MQLQFKNIFRFCAKELPMTRVQRLRFEENVRNNRENTLKQFRWNASNQQVTQLDNFKKFKNDPIFLDRCEIETRIMKRLHHTEFVDLKKFKFSQDMREQMKLDSLNIVIVLTEIENEFTTVFEDKVFETVRSLQEIVDILVRDEKIM